MPQVRCHIHRGSKLRTQCFFTPLELCFSFMWLYLRRQVWLKFVHNAATSLLTRLTPTLFIVSNNRAIAQVSTWIINLILILSFSHLMREGRKRQKPRCAEITRSEQRRGVNNGAVVPETTEVGLLLGVRRASQAGDQHLSLSQRAVPKCESYVIKCHVIG